MISPATPASCALMKSVKVLGDNVSFTAVSV
jgi:hypothetical protein